MPYKENDLVLVSGIISKIYKVHDSYCRVVSIRGAAANISLEQIERKLTKIEISLLDLNRFSFQFDAVSALNELYLDQDNYMSNLVYKRNPLLSLIPKNESLTGSSYPIKVKSKRK